MASNCTGTVNDTRRFAAQARAAGAIVYLDAVQFAPHYAIDVQDLGADIVVSSAYKWFGPHQGILWGRKALLEEVAAEMADIRTVLERAGATATGPVPQALDTFRIVAVHPVPERLAVHATGRGGARPV